MHGFERRVVLANFRLLKVKHADAKNPLGFFAFAKSSRYVFPTVLFFLDCEKSMASTYGEDPWLVFFKAKTKAILARGAGPVLDPSSALNLSGYAGEKIVGLKIRFPST